MLAVKIPKGVPITYPIKAMRIPTGTKEPEYEPANTGAEAVPPMLARDATAPVKRSIFKSLQIKSINTPWIARMIKPVIIQAGASVSSVKEALEANKQITL